MTKEVLSQNVKTMYSVWFYLISCILQTVSNIKFEWLKKAVNILLGFIGKMFLCYKNWGMLYKNVIGSLMACCKQ